MQLVKLLYDMQNCNLMMACMYGAPDKKMYPIECYNGVTITTSEIISIKAMCTSGKEWTVSFVTEPAMVQLQFSSQMLLISCWHL